MRLREMIDLPPLWLLLFAALAWGQARAWPVAGIFGPWSDWTGRLLVVAGLALVLAAALRLRRHRTTVIPHRAARALVTDGVYAWSRNPIYLGDAMVLAGLSLEWGAVAGLVLVPLFMAVIARRFIAPEEQRLRQAFGGDFDAWAKRTRRWL